MADLPLRRGLLNRTSYRAPQLSVSVRMNTNESPFPPTSWVSEDILASLREAVSSLHRYPDRDAIELRTDLADYISRQTGVAVEFDNIWAANGSLEILQQLMQVFGGSERSALSFVPSYSMYASIATTTEVEWLEIARDADFSLNIDKALAAILEHAPDIVFLTNPHNPTGQSMAIADLQRILEAASGIVIVDEAYGEFSSVPSAIGLIDRFPTRLMVTRTLSKAFGFAGGRLGYLVAAPEAIEALKLVSLPYHLSALTQAAARAVLRHADEIIGHVAEFTKERERITRVLRHHRFDVVDSAANFLLFGRFTDAALAWQYYLDQGVLIRDIGIPHYLRMSIGNAAENDRFIEITQSLEPMDP
ncbi:histidinol-phosphate transaminase [Nocardia sp. GCM10030253]|uniref:histidinol-phosphate transaminase n=1 Tax=Nocardia sp. GCM10030253 TaxID=3273404 RepID=UPI00362D1DB7